MKLEKSMVHLLVLQSSPDVQNLLIPRLRVTLKELPQILRVDLL